MSNKRLGYIVVIGLVAGGCGGHWTGPHWVGGNPNAPFAPPPEETKTSTVAAAEASRQHPVTNETAPVSSPKPVEVEATAVPAPVSTPATNPAPSVAPAPVPVHPILPVAKLQVKVPIHPLDVPPDVQGTFARDYPGSDIKQVIKKTDGEGHVTYWYRFDDLSYHEHFATYSDSGKQLSEKAADFWKDFFKYDQRPPQNRYTQGSLD